MLSKAKIEKYAPYVVWVFFALFCYRYAIEISSGGNKWKTGDWLINYSAGFVRRGLAGSILLKISDLGIPLLWLTYALGVGIYAAVFAMVLKIYNRKERGLFWLLILFSPAFLLFPYYDIQGGFRKEILVLAVFSYFSLIYANQRVTHLSLIFIIVAYSVAALSHELTVLTLPFFLYLLYASIKEGLIQSRAAFAYGAILTIASSVFLFLASSNKGGPAFAQAICESLTARNLDPNICEGAIHSLSKDTSDAHSSVINGLSYKSTFTPILLALALLPLSFTTWWNKERVFLLAASLATIFPLFLVALDWGRWIYIVIFMVFCLVLASEVTNKYGYRRIFVIAGLFYLTTWSVPHCCVGGSGTGLIGRLMYYPGKLIKTFGGF